MKGCQHLDNATVQTAICAESAADSKTDMHWICTYCERAYVHVLKTRNAYLDVKNTNRYIQIWTPQKSAYLYVSACIRVECIQHTYNVIHICTWYSTDKYSYENPKRMHICMYLHVWGLNVSHIHTHMHKIQLIGYCDTYTYKRIQAYIALCYMLYARVISDMHSALSRAYECAYLYVSFSDAYKI